MSRANYSLSMIETIICKCSPDNCKTILIGTKHIHLYVKVNYICFKFWDTEKNSKQFFRKFSLNFLKRLGYITANM